MGRRAKKREQEARTREALAAQQQAFQNALNQANAHSQNQINAISQNFQHALNVNTQQAQAHIASIKQISDSHTLLVEKKVGEMKQMQEDYQRELKESQQTIKTTVETYQKEIEKLTGNVTQLVINQNKLSDNHSSLINFMGTQQGAFNRIIMGMASQINYLGGDLRMIGGDIKMLTTGNLLVDK